MVMQWIINHQWVIRVVAFGLLLVALGGWETRQTWRQWQGSRRQRWMRHGTLLIISQVLIKWMMPAFPVGIAILIAKGKIGIFHQVTMPYFLSLVLGIFLLDAMMYWQHRWLHRYRWLWRFHQVHHMDTELDVTTGLRFHPLEVLFTTGVKVMSIGFFGIDVFAVILYELFYGTAVLWTHLNVKLSPPIERTIRWLFVTPNMHRLHHSDVPFETNSNYGFCLSAWDKIGRSYRQSAVTGEKYLVMGLAHYRDPEYQRLANMLGGPFYTKLFRIRRKKAPKLYFR